MSSIDDTMLSRLLRLKNTVKINGLPLHISYNLWTGIASVSYGSLKVEKILVWNGGEINILNIKIKFRGYLNPYAEIYVNNTLYTKISNILKFKAKHYRANS
ncbi:MAG: hypothetical protein QXP91_09510 [Candidatus Methanomethylicia archaeon]